MRYLLALLSALTFFGCDNIMSTGPSRPDEHQHPPIEVEAWPTEDGEILIRWAVRHRGPFTVVVEGFEGTTFRQTIRLGLERTFTTWDPSDLPTGTYAFRIETERPPAAYGYSPQFEFPIPLALIKPTQLAAPQPIDVALEFRGEQILIRWNDSRGPFNVFIEKPGTTFRRRITRGLDCSRFDWTIENLEAGTYAFRITSQETLGFSESFEFSVVEEEEDLIDWPSMGQCFPDAPIPFCVN